MARGIFLCLALYLAYRFGWLAAHGMVAQERRRNESFFVGNSTFKCTETKKNG